jgi:hypothetical protein
MKCYVVANMRTQRALSDHDQQSSGKSHDQIIVDTLDSPIIVTTFHYNTNTTDKDNTGKQHNN